jgi:hypothetical protein
LVTLDQEPVSQVSEIVETGVMHGLNPDRLINRQNKRFLIRKSEPASKNRRYKTKKRKSAHR